MHNIISETSRQMNGNGGLYFFLVSQKKITYYPIIISAMISKELFLIKGKQIKLVFYQKVPLEGVVQTFRKQIIGAFATKGWKPQKKIIRIGRLSTVYKNIANNKKAT